MVSMHTFICFKYQGFNLTMSFYLGSGLLDESQIFGFPLANYGFGSETANLEYSILSNMLQAPTDVLKTQTNNFAQPLMSRPLTDEESSVATQPSTTVSTPITALWPHTAMPNGSPVQEATGSPTTANPFINSSGLLMQSTTSSPEIQQSQVANTAFAKPLPRVKRDSTTERLGGRRKGNVGNTPEAVYANVKRPFSYAEGYHYLISFVKER
jgi:hypothetical protein